MSDAREEKLSQLRKLGEKRRDARLDKFKCIQDFYCGRYDSDWVSPYTKSACNPDAKWLFVLQDWASEDWLNKQGFRADLADLGHAPELPTNRNLRSLITYVIKEDISEVFVTNLFPFVKPGQMRRSIGQRILRRCARDFLLPQIAVIRPKNVVCLGLDVWKAVGHELGLSVTQDLASAIKSRCQTQDGWWLYCQSHPGGQGVANRGGCEAVREDWSTMFRHSSQRVDATH